MKPTSRKPKSVSLAKKAARIEPTEGTISTPKFIVGVGASAGGLDALGRFFGAIPAKTGLAFIVVQHLSPDHKSFMVELLSRKSAMPVEQAEDGAAIRADHVYLMPPRTLLKIFQGRIVLVDLNPDSGLRLPIDVFFRSLADDQQGRAIGVILSGTGSDGALGVRAIKDAGGMVMVQSEASAEFDGMPRSAIGTGVADFISPPEELPTLLLQYVVHPFAVRDGLLVREETAAESAMRQLFAVMRERTGVDFSYYKPATIDRRIERRMSVQQIDSLLSYVRFLETSPQETEILFNNLLICVTRFFRDRKMWELLEHEVLPKRLESLPPDAPFRAWMPGCSTGEEAYSAAMLIDEIMERMGRQHEVKIFATDVSKESLEIASLGVYSQSMVADMPPQRLARHFIQRQDGFQIRQAIRQSVVFARHDILKDPPFARMDFVCCRNLLIYFQPILQTKVVQSFRNSLLPDGILVLGSSETLGGLTDRFTTINGRQRIYALKEGSGPAELPIIDRAGRASETLHVTALRPVRGAVKLSSTELITREVVRAVSPACFVVDEDRELVQVFGRGGEYLRHPDGEVTNQILRLTSHNLASALGPALHKAAQTNAEFIYEGVHFSHLDERIEARLKVRPLTAAGLAKRLFLVFIEDIRSQAPISAATNFQGAEVVSHRISELEQELTLAREGLQATVEELETSNEELQASNEELLASNEELQSTNEELQSVNEELHTVNAEHHSRIEELVGLSNEVSNLFTLANLGAIFVDSDLRLRKMASAVFKLTGLTPADLGAPIEVLCRQLDSPAVLAMATRVRQSGESEEVEVVTPRGPVLLVRAVPFQNEFGQNSGLVLTIVDITVRSKSDARIAASERLLRGVLNSVPSHIAVLDEHGVITHVNEAWDRFARQNCKAGGATFGVGVNYLEVCRSASVGPFGDDARKVMDGMEAVLSGRIPHFELEYPCHSPTEQRWFHLQVTSIALPAPGLVVSHTRLVERRPALPAHTSIQQ